MIFNKMEQLLYFSTCFLLNFLINPLNVCLHQNTSIYQNDIIYNRINVGSSSVKNSSVSWQRYMTRYLPRR